MAPTNSHLASFGSAGSEPPSERTAAQGRQRNPDTKRTRRRILISAVCPAKCQESVGFLKGPGSTTEQEREEADCHEALHRCRAWRPGSAVGRAGEPPRGADRHADSKPVSRR